MSIQFEKEIERVNRDILSMAGNVEQMIRNSIRALCERKFELVSEVLKTDHLVDEAEVEIEQICLNLLLLHQPMASQLRRVSTILKINSDLERIADLACNISERADCLREYPYFPAPDELPLMAENAVSMVRMALDSFVDMDTSVATEVIQKDRIVDDQNRQIIIELKGLMQSDYSLIEPALHCFSASRHIERIADHAENIAEDVIYLIDAKIVRHQHGEFLKQDSQDQ